MNLVKNFSLFVLIVVSAFFLFSIEHGWLFSGHAFIVTEYLYYAFFIAFFLIFIKTRLFYLFGENKKFFTRFDSFQLIIVFFLIILFALKLYRPVRPYLVYLPEISAKTVIVFSLINVIRTFSRISRFGRFLASFATKPAQTIVVSFASLIGVGTLILMLPAVTADATRLGFIDAFFTATSATCVTGLVVLDTATRFSIYGKVVIMLLIQAGGLGIMILSSFAAFIVGRSISWEDRLTLSYMMNEEDMSNLSSAVKTIILITFLIEICGAIILFFAFSETISDPFKCAFYSLFHSISAFCNAGFALYSDSFMGFQDNYLVNGVLASLILIGGLSFAVTTNLYKWFVSTFRKKVLRHSVSLTKISINTSVVLSATAILTVAGTLFIYQCEHASALFSMDVLSQYTAAFFQAVTLRTAGFNTIDISALSMSTMVLMLVFMFIGGASGSTAGGVKVNTIGVFYAYIKSMFSSKDDIVIMKHSLSRELVNRALVVIVLSAVIVFAGFFLLCVCEPDKRFDHVLFEVVSAFGTVGLSAGITGDLSPVGKLIVVAMMFVGRIGPVTMMTALVRRRKAYRIRYPQGRINVG